MIVNSNYYREIEAWFRINDGLGHIRSNFTLESIYAVWVRDASGDDVVQLEKHVDSTVSLVIEANTPENYSLFWYPTDVNKEAGLAKYCDYYRIDPQEVAFIGNDHMDIEVARQVGLSAAVSNADWEFVTVVDLVMDEPLSGGVLSFLQYLKSQLLTPQGIV